MKKVAQAGTESWSALDAAFDAGVNFIDTADNYGLGNCETLYGTSFTDPECFSASFWSSPAASRFSSRWC